MERLLVLTIIISTFLIFSASIIHAQGFPPLWQYPYFYGQYGQPWGFQSSMPGYFGKYNYIPQPWSSPQRFSSESSSQLGLNSETIYGQNEQYYTFFNQTPGGFNSPPTWNPFYARSSLNSDIPPGLPDLSAITYYPSMGAYYAPQLSNWESGPKYFTSGAIFFTYDYTGRTWALNFFKDSPGLYSNGTLITAQGSSQVETIIIEEDGKTFTFEPGEMFRIVLPMYDDISNEEFPLVAGWNEEGREQWSPGSIDFYGFEPKSIGLEEDEEGNLMQENTYRAIKERPNAKELVFNYHGPSGQNDTFRVTIRVQGSGNYAPSY